jgi:hypothetical protein
MKSSLFFAVAARPRYFAGAVSTTGLHANENARYARGKTLCFSAAWQTNKSPQFTMLCSFLASTRGAATWQVFK